MTNRTFFKRISLAGVLRIFYRKAKVKMKRLVTMLLQNSRKDVMKSENRMEAAEMVRCDHTQYVLLD